MTATKPGKADHDQQPVPQRDVQLTADRTASARAPGNCRWRRPTFCMKIRHKHRRERQGKQQRPGQGKGVRIGHRTKDLSLGPAHREQRQQGADHDQRREEQAPLDFAGGAQDALLPAAGRRPRPS